MKQPVKSPAAKSLALIHWAAASAGFLATAFLGWNLAGGGESRSSTASADIPHERSSREARPGKVVRGPTGPAARQLQAIRLARDPNERARAIVDLASQLSPAEFGEWFENGWFNIRGGEGQTLFTKIIRERWQQEDPEGLLLWSIKNKRDIAGDMIASWADTEPQRILDFFREHPDSNREMQVLASMAKKNPAMALQRLQELAAEGLSRDRSAYTGSLMEQLAKHSPAGLEAAIPSLTGSLKVRAETALIGERIKTSYSDELHKLFERPDGVKLYTGVVSDGDVPDEVKGKLFDELANLPAAWRNAIGTNPYYFLTEGNASKWITTDLDQYGFNEMQITSIRSRAISQLANKQPEAALRMMVGLDMTQENRESMLGNIFEIVAGKKDQAQAMIAMLETDADRQIALTVISSSNDDEGERPSRPKIEKPQDWMDAATTIDTSKGSSYEFYAVLRKWDKTQIEALAGQFRAMPDESKRKVAEVIAGNPYSSAPGQLDAEAIRYLVANPAVFVPQADLFEQETLLSQKSAENKTVNLASIYVGKIAKTDPEEAAEWIQTLPEGDAKLWARRNLHSIWSQFDPKAADEWKSSLPAKDRDTVAMPKK